MYSTSVRTEPEYSEQEDLKRVLGTFRTARVNLVILPSQREGR